MKARARGVGDGGVLVAEEGGVGGRAALQLEVRQRPKVRQQLLGLRLVKVARETGHSQAAVAGGGACSGQRIGLRAWRRLLGRAVEQGLRVCIQAQRHVVVEVGQRDVEGRLVLQQKVAEPTSAEPAEVPKKATGICAQQAHVTRVHIGDVLGRALRRRHLELAREKGLMQSGHL